jgi:hypothetical protein
MTQDLSSEDYRKELLNEVSTMIVGIEKVRKILQRATPLADNLAVMKALDKTLKGLEKIRFEFRTMRL